MKMVENDNEIQHDASFFFLAFVGIFGIGLNCNALRKAIRVSFSSSYILSYSKSMELIMLDNFNDNIYTRFCKSIGLQNRTKYGTNEFDCQRAFDISIWCAP